MVKHQLNLAKLKNTKLTSNRYYTDVTNNVSFKNVLVRIGWKTFGESIFNRYKQYKLIPSQYLTDKIDTF